MKDIIDVFKVEACELAMSLGASAVESLPASAVPIEENLVRYCSDGCEDYGLSANCPPYVMGPLKLQEIIADYSLCIIFKIDLSGDFLMDERRYPIMENIHSIAVGVEKFAIKRGYCNSMGFACGSCHRLFCSAHEKCQAREPCRTCAYPEKARPSISGFGINVFEMAENIGWEMERVLRDTPPEDISSGMLCGMILVG